VASAAISGLRGSPPHAAKERKRESKTFDTVHILFSFHFGSTAPARVVAVVLDGVRSPEPGLPRQCSWCLCVSGKSLNLSEDRSGRRDNERNYRANIMTWMKKTTAATTMATTAATTSGKERETTKIPLERKIWWPNLLLLLIYECSSYIW